MTDEQFVIMEEHTRDILERLIALEHTVGKRLITLEHKVEVQNKELQRMQLIQLNGGI